MGVHEIELADPRRHRRIALGWSVGDIERPGDGSPHRVPDPADLGQRLAVEGEPFQRDLQGLKLVEQQVIAAPRRRLQRFRSSCRHPKRRMRLLGGRRFDNDILERPALALMREAALGGPGGADHRHHLLEAFGGLLDRNLKPFELGKPIALSDAEIKAAMRQKIQSRGLLGDQYRVVPG